ncbi:MAG: sigma 54-interacting transcriptional regulator [Bacillota bacterium]|nr:sigma 54-interacting transcriptional regulator [Bacillota bacterium]
MERIKALEERIEELEKENSLYKAIIEVVHEGIMATDKEGRIIVYNQEIAKTEKMNPQEVIGKLEREVYNYPEYNFPEIVAEKVLQKGESIIEQRYFYPSPNGEMHHIVFSAHPYFYKGKIEGVITMGRDVEQINSFITATLAFERQLKADKNKDGDVAHYFLDNIIGSAPQMKKCRELSKKVAQYDIPVMIIGETGTGKELFAQGIHNASPFAAGPFISVNCAALPDTLLESILFGTSKGSFTGAVNMPGLFEQAEGGSLFLDEINSMPQELQSKLLRAIQEKKVRRLGSKTEIPVNCRIISASNQNPFDLHAEAPTAIRPDLLFRLSTAVIQIPPLRERKEDIPELCKYFMRTSNQCKSIFLWEISPDLLKLFYRYDWPGNVRELENVILGSVIFAGNQERFLKIQHIPEHIQRNLLGEDGKKSYPFPAHNLNDSIKDFEKHIILETIFSVGGNISKAARILGITRQNLYFKIDRHHLKDYIKSKTNQKV